MSPRSDWQASRGTVSLIVNLVVPGLGSILGGRVASGVAQLVLGLSGIAVSLWALARTLALLDAPDPDVGLTDLGRLVLGPLLIVASWIWALVDGLALHRRRERGRDGVGP
jgi:hypothetical protein